MRYISVIINATIDLFYHVYGYMFRPLGGHLQATVVYKVKMTTALYFLTKSNRKNMK